MTDRQAKALMLRLEILCGCIAALVLAIIFSAIALCTAIEGVLG